jgi:hypothetical protein
MSRSTGRIRLAIQFMSRRENGFISSITLAPLRSFLPWWGAAVASMFYILERRHSAWPMALCTTLIMAPSSLFRLQSGLALSDMFGMVFMLAFLLVKGASPPRIHDKHHFEFIFEFGKSDRTRVETPSVND